MASETLPVLTHPSFPQVFEEAIGRFVRSIEPPRERYFAIVIKADADCDLGGAFNASTNLGNHLRERERVLLPDGAKITRSIEITKDMATRTW